MKINEDSYLIPVSGGLLRHYKKMKDAVWLFLWYIDKTTTEKEADGAVTGYVLGRSPVIDARPANDLGCHRATTARWRLELERAGYVKTKRTPFGYVIRVLKSKKWILIRKVANHGRKVANHERKVENPYRQHRDNTVTKGAARPLSDAEKRLLAIQRGLTPITRQEENENSERTFARLKETPEGKAVAEALGL